MPPETQGLVVIDGHICESSWIANKVTVGRYGADFNVIQDAVSYCDAMGGEWTILLHPRGEAGAAVWDEIDITPNGGAIITIKGIGEGRVRIAPTGDPVAAVIVSGHTLNLEDVDVVAFSAGFPALRVTGGAFEATGSIIQGVGAGDAVQQVGGTVLIHDCQVPVGDIDLTDAACVLTLTDCNINGTLDTSDGVGAGVVMTVAVRHCDLNDQAINYAATGACVYAFESCNHMGNITDASLGAGAVNGHICRGHVVGGLVKNGTTGWLIDNSELLAINSTNATGEITVSGGIVLTVTSSGGIIRLIGTQYRAINRSATGNIVDQSPYLADMPWHVQKWSWQAALANSQVAVRGTPIDGGSGQVLLEVTLNAAPGARVEAVEQLPEAGGARENSLIPLRTPRMITQFMWDRTGANEFVFFGLRETLGNAYPAAAEESAGFHYDSATGFVARSSTAAGNEDTVMGVAPDHLGIIQLEVIIFGGVRVEFYIDGVLVASHTTRVPTANLRWQHILYTDGGGAATDVDVEILNGGCQQCPDSVPA